MEHKNTMNLKLTLEKALEAYNNANSEGKKLLEDLYGKEHFQDIFDRLTGYESACEILGRTPKTLAQFEAFFPTKKQAKRQFARHKIVTGCEAISEGWEADFENENQYKYYNWMYNKKNGLGLYGNVVHCSSGSGSDLYLETPQKRDHIGKIFSSEYATYLFGY